MLCYVTMLVYQRVYTCTVAAKTWDRSAASGWSPSRTFPVVQPCWSFSAEENKWKDWKTWKEAWKEGEYGSIPIHFSGLFTSINPSYDLGWTKGTRVLTHPQVKAKVDEAEKPKKDTKAGLRTPPHPPSFHWWDHVCHAMSDFRAGKGVKTEPSLSLLKRNHSNPKSTMMCCHKHILNENMYLLILAYSHEWIQAHNGRIS